MVLLLIPFSNSISSSVNSTVLFKGSFGRDGGGMGKVGFVLVRGGLNTCKGSVGKSSSIAMGPSISTSIGTGEGGLELGGGDVEEFEGGKAESMVKSSIFSIVFSVNKVSISIPGISTGFLGLFAWNLETSKVKNSFSYFSTFSSSL